jgi:HD-GYP domain-containing protein (c-di-GMP phosphodiesterase class II)
LQFPAAARSRVIKKISIDQLKPGMFVHDLNVDWMAHPFLRQRFVVQDDAAVSKIRAAGIRELYVDTSRGSDVPDAPTEADVRRSVESAMLKVAAEPPPAPLTMSAAEEMSRATKIYEAAGNAVRHVMRDVCLGKAVEVAEVEAVVEDITSSVVRNSGALISLMRLKTADDYTFLHCVAVGTLMVTFTRSQGLEAETVRQAGIGGLMHDVGKMQVPDAVLNKPGKLTDEEFGLIKRHPRRGTGCW